MTTMLVSDGLTLALVTGLAGLVSGYAWGNYRRMLAENQGEGAVRRRLTRAFPGKEYHLMNNLTLPSQDGTTQIDHVLVARGGIFVLESKHYSGTIVADAQAATWTHQVGPMTYQFQNPLRQNYRHLKAIQTLLAKIPHAHIHAYVVFTGTAAFQGRRPAYVFDLLGLVDHLSTYTDPVLSEQIVEWCVGRLECTRKQISRQTDVEHQAYLQRKFGEM